MIFNFFALTDTGRTRENNEDSVSFDAGTGVAVLADGMGGYNAGEVASGMATSFIQEELGTWFAHARADIRPRDIRRAMETCVHNANLSIYNSAFMNPDYAGMGTTLVMGVFRPDAVQIGHVGDSRCYRSRDGVLEQITRDHSLLQEQIDAGLVTPEQAQYSTIKNLVTRAVGVEATTLLEINAYEPKVGDIYLMCSDGLSDMLNQDTIAKIVLANLDLAKKAELLIAAANESGGRDNISVLLVEATEAPGKRGLVARFLGS